MMIIAAVLITLGSLTAFNIDVKKVYLTGAYKSRFRGMEFTALKDVEQIDIQGANRMTVKIERGNKEGIWINESAKGKVLAAVNQHKLKLELSAQSEADGYRPWNEIIIVTKNLSQLNLASYLRKGEDNGYNEGDVTISGYTAKQFDVQVSKSVNVFINQMNITSLNAAIGSQNEGEAELTLSSDTKVEAARFNIPGAGNLTLHNPSITKVVYNLSDSATVTLSGKVVRMIR